MREGRLNPKESYQPEPASFNTYIEYTLAHPGQKTTYTKYKRFKAYEELENHTRNLYVNRQKDRRPGTQTKKEGGKRYGNKA